MKRAKSESLDPNNTQILHFDAKRTKLNHEEKKYNCNLLDLSDDVLLHIFKYLSSFDLMALHLCCLRLSELCCDRTLWKSLDLRTRYLPLEELEKYVKFMQPVTRLLAIRGNKKKNEFPELHPSFLNTISLKCEQLQEFILEDYSISQEKIQITNFPKTLKKLSLKGCQIFKGHLVQMNKSYLCKIDTHMPNLTCLILTNCNWLNSHSFMAISKIPKLKEVRLNSCYGLSEDIAYASLACRYGLKSLEVLDLQDTFVGDSVISSFSHTSTLTDIYLECPSSGTVQHQPDEHPQQREVLYVQLQRGPEVVYENNHVAVELVNENDLHHLIVNLVNNTDRCQVSDRSICALGLRNNENNQEIIHNRDEVQLVQGRPRTSTNPNLRKLVVRNYTGVTNQTLLHFVVNGPNLEHLDVTGTSVTKEGLQYFKIQRPDVNLISSFGEINSV